MSLFNTAPGTFGEGLEASNIILTDETNQVYFGSDEGTILSMNTAQDKTIHIQDVGKDVDLVYVDTGSSNITDFTVQTSVNFSGNLSGDVSGTQGFTSVDKVGSKFSGAVSIATQRVEDSSSVGAVDEIVKLDGSGNFSCNQITATLNGSATSFSGSLSGEVSGTQTNTVVDSIGPYSSTDIVNGIAKTQNAASDHTLPTNYGELIQSDVSGNFSANTITASLSGTASNASLLNNKNNSITSVANTIVERDSNAYINADLFVGDLSGNSNTSTTCTTANDSLLLNGITNTNLNTPSTVVSRDGSGNFSAGTITASLTGNATTCTMASDSLLLNGITNTDANTPSTVVSRDSSGNFSAGLISGNLAGNASTSTHATNVILNVGSTAVSDVEQSVVDTQNATNLNTVTTIVKRDSSGNFNAGTITASLTGNATTATTSNDSLLLNGITNTNWNTASTVVSRDSNGDFEASMLTLNNLLVEGSNFYNKILVKRNNNSTIFNIDTIDDDIELYGLTTKIKGDTSISGANSTTKFQIENLSGTPFFTLNSTGSRVIVKGDDNANKFWVENNATTKIFKVDTVNGNVAIEGDDNANKFWVENALTNKIFTVDTVDDYVQIPYPRNVGTTDVAFDGSEGALNINGDITLYNGTRNTIFFDSHGVGAPTATNRSAGEKICLYPIAGGIDYAMGISNSTMWYGVPNNTTYHRWYAGTNNNMYLRNNGSTGLVIQSTNATYKFAVDDSSNTTVFYVNTSNKEVYTKTLKPMTGAEDVGYNNAGTFDDMYSVNAHTATSDATKKDNIEDSDLGLDFIMQLRPKKYKFKDWVEEIKTTNKQTEEESIKYKERKYTRTHYGLLAQDVKKTLGKKDFGGYVDGKYKDPVNGLLGLRYGEFIAPMIKAIQEQQQQLDTAFTTINDLQSQINELKKI